MFKWIRNKLNKNKNKCKHYKEFGEKYPDNMVSILRFSPHKRDTIGYGISECIECGTRSFTCILCHAMGDDMCKVIDDFIGYKITKEEFQLYLDKEMTWYNWE